MKLREHALSLFFAAIFLAAVAGQSAAGLFTFNEEQLANGAPTVSWITFVTSSDFVVDVAENWQSEFLQFTIFIWATIWLVQKGSPESKKPGDEGLGTDEQQLVGPYARPDSPAWAKADGWRRTLYSNSLLLAMGGIFILSWLAQGVAGTLVYNDHQLLNDQPTITVGQYFLSAEFWNRTLQNWQSEFLAVGAMVTLTIFLRQRGSHESKPVGTPHDQTAESSD